MFTPVMSGRICSQGLTTMSAVVPLASVVRKTSSVPRPRPVPVRVMDWPGMAEAWLLLAGVPLVALALMLTSVMGSAAEVPPTVRTLIGPVGRPAGTVRLMALSVRPALEK
jgi:hypothetical protein